MPNTMSANSDVVDFVRIGQRVSLDYRVDVRDYATFEAVMAVADGCNAFDPAVVAKTFRELFGDISHVEFGAESSTVMYVHLASWSHQRSGAPSIGAKEKYTNEELRRVAGRVITWARSMGAGEICSYGLGRAEPTWNGTGERPHRIRIWWD